VPLYARFVRSILLLVSALPGSHTPWRFCQQKHGLLALPLARYRPPGSCRRSTCCSVASQDFNALYPPPRRQQRTTQIEHCLDDEEHEC
jgi:hypothetical protein